MGAVVIFDHGLKFCSIFLVSDHPCLNNRAGLNFLGVSGQNAGIGFADISYAK